MHKKPNAIKLLEEIEKAHPLVINLLYQILDYEKIKGIRLEARQKLNKIQPKTIGQASRIPGVSPNDINVLLVLSGR